MQETGSLKKSNDDDVNNVDNNVADANAAAACKQNIQVGASTFVKIGIRIKFFFRLVWTDCLGFFVQIFREVWIQPLALSTFYWGEILGNKSRGKTGNAHKLGTLFDTCDF